MNTTQKGNERLYISKSTKALNARIDEMEYFGLHNGATNRQDLLLFAMAIGADAMPMPFQGGESFVRAESIGDTTKALIHAFYISNKLSADSLDKIENTADVFLLAQQYANTGFGILENAVDTKKPMDFAWELFRELDNQYKAEVED